MQEISSRLEELVFKHAEKLKQIGEEASSVRPALNKWSKKDELGHLIDSAQNNLRRFIVAQYETDPQIVYNQDEWVRMNHYNSQPWLQLLRFWLLLNQQIAHVLKNLPESSWSCTCNTGKKSPELHTIEWLAEDYIRHLKHHLHHILELEPIPY